MSGKQIVYNGKCLPKVRMSMIKNYDGNEMTENELNAELEKGYSDMMAGSTKSVRKIFFDIHKDYEI